MTSKDGTTWNPLMPWKRSIKYSSGNTPQEQSLKKQNEAIQRAMKDPKSPHYKKNIIDKLVDRVLEV